MTEIDPLAPLRGRGPFSMDIIEQDGCSSDVVVDKHGKMFPFEVTAAHATPYYDRDLADLKAMRHALNLALAADEQLQAKEAEIARLQQLLADENAQVISLIGDVQVAEARQDILQARVRKLEALARRVEECAGDCPNSVVKLATEALKE